LEKKIMSEHSAGKVYFIGAGPGDPDLITVKGRNLIRAADLVLYAGSLVPGLLVAETKKTAQVLDSSPLHLEELHRLMRDCALRGGLVARVHSGDPGLYGAVREQMELLEADGIACAVVPGISAAFAAAAAAKVSLTQPEEVQSLVVTRLGGRTPMPDGQRVADYARHGGSLAVYLSAGMETLAAELQLGGLAKDTAILIAHKVSHPEEELVWTNLDGLEETLAKHAFDAQTLFLVLPGEHARGKAARVEKGGKTRSRLYDANFQHGKRKK
jgi:precorrin-4/cobalt-precorrin-4 C11-methyltransferase